MWKLPTETCNIHESKVKHDAFVSAAKDLIQKTRTQMTRMNEMSTQMRELADQIQVSRRTSVDKLKNRRNSLVEILAKNKQERRKSVRENTFPEHQSPQGIEKMITQGRRASLTPHKEISESVKKKYLTDKLMDDVRSKSTDENLYKDYERRGIKYRANKMSFSSTDSSTERRKERTRNTTSPDSSNDGDMGHTENSKFHGSRSTVKVKKLGMQTVKFSIAKKIHSPASCLYPVKGIHRSLTPRQPLDIPKVNVGSHVTQSTSVLSMGSNPPKDASPWRSPRVTVKPLVYLPSQSFDVYSMEDFYAAIGGEDTRGRIGTV